MGGRITQGNRIGRCGLDSSGSGQEPLNTVYTVMNLWVVKMAGNFLSS
jgi:hypothetical protein